MYLFVDDRLNSCLGGIDWYDLSPTSQAVVDETTVEALSRVVSLFPKFTKC